MKKRTAEESNTILEKGYINALSEIVTLQNDLLDYGRIQSIEEKALVFGPSREGFDLTELSFGTAVKINIHQARLGYKVLSGMVSASTRERLRVTGLEIITATDNRQFLRVRTRARAVVTPLEVGPGQAEKSVTVSVEDISLGGMLFSTPIVFGMDELLTARLSFFDFTLEPLCRIRRITQRDGNSHYYGCQFEELTPQQEDALYRILMRLQQERRAHYRG